MDPIGQDRRLETTDHGVGDDPHGQEVNGRYGMHPRKCADGGRAAYDQHETHEDIRHESEDHEHEMGHGAVSRLDAVRVPSVSPLSSPITNQGKTLTLPKRCEH